MQSFRGEVWTNATQWKIVGRVFQLYFVFGGLIFLCGMLLYLKSRPRVDQLDPSDLWMIEKLLRDLNFELLLWFGGFGFIYIGLFALVALAEFQRVIAPIEKIEVILRRAAETGIVPEKIRFRRADAFQSLGVRFNEFTEMLRSQKS